MPRNTREYLLRYADQAINDYDRAIEKLLLMKSTYEPTHEKYAKFVDIIAVRTVAIQKDLQDFRKKFM